MTTPRVRKEAAKAAVDLVVRKALQDAGRSAARVALERLLRHVRERSDLLRPTLNRGRAGALTTPEIVSGLAALAAHFKAWLRPIEEWVPREANARPQFLALAHHLFANYPVPAFLVSAWFRGPIPDAYMWQRRFIHWGRGQSVRTMELPARLNRAMAHELGRVPAHLSVEHALRWAQVRGLSGDDALAQAVCASRLGSHFENEDFWLTVLQFFVNHPRLDLRHVRPIVEYLHHQKFHYERVIIGEDTEIGIAPPQPDLTMKGRTPASLLRRAAEWQEQRSEPPPVRRYFSWPASPIGGFRRIDDQERVWTIRELLDSDELAAEGKAMHHCVAEYYVASCHQRSATIWSLGLELPQERERVLTIEVDPNSRSIDQASMHCNEEPDAWCREVLRQWAEQEGLTIECQAEEPVVAL